MQSSCADSVVSSNSLQTTRRTALRALVGAGALGILGVSVATPVAAVPTQPAGSGTELDPYVITTVQELQWIGTSGPLNAYYVLGNDIDASATAGWNGGAGFIPIGTEAFPFTGSFDGKGYTISRLFIDAPNQSRIGLFGYTGGGASITNVTLADLTVTGLNLVGGLVGYNSAGTVSDSSASGRVTGDRSVGGLVGDNRGTVSGSSASGKVTGDRNVGGLAGSNLGEVSGSEARGKVTGSFNVGGLVGNNDDFGAVSESEASGRVSGVDSVGGLVGLNDGRVCGSTAQGSVSGTGDNVGDLVGGGGGTVEDTCPV